MKLYMVIVGCKPKGRFTEQHDVFFGVGETLRDLLPQIEAFWPEANGNVHIDSWREVTTVGNYEITVCKKDAAVPKDASLFFINLGGYKPNDPEEYHYKLLAVGRSLADVTKTAKETAFYKHFGFRGAVSHIDDKYGIDVDDAQLVEEMLARPVSENFALRLQYHNEPPVADQLHIGYLSIAKIKAE